MDTFFIMMAIVVVTVEILVVLSHYDKSRGRVAQYRYNHEAKEYKTKARIENISKEADELQTRCDDLKNRLRQAN